MKTSLKSTLLTTLMLGIAEGLIPALLIKNGFAAWPPARNLFSVLGVFFILLGLPIQIWVAWAFREVWQGYPCALRPAQRIRRLGALSLCAQPNVLWSVVRPHRLGVAHPFHVDACLRRLFDHRPAHFYGGF